MKTLLVSLVLLVVSVCFFSCGSNDDTLTRWNTYEGKVTILFKDFNVQIEDYSYNGSSTIRRIMHMHPVGMESYVGITGHDYNGDGTWNRVFYCGLDGNEENTTGCNSVLFDEENYTWTFEPCPGDEGKVKPFTEDQIKAAISALNYGMENLHNEKYLTMTLEKWQEKYR